MIGAPVLVVVLVIAAFLVIKANQKPAVATGAPSAPAGSTLENSIKNVPASTFDAGGKGTGVNPPTVISGAALTANGKPRVLYIGAEFCPYCAAERWAMITALSGSGPSPISGHHVFVDGCLPEHGDPFVPRRDVHQHPALVHRRRADHQHLQRDRRLHAP